MPQRTNIYLSEIQIKKLKKIAFETDLTMSEHIRRAIDEYLKQYTQAKGGMKK